MPKKLICDLEFVAIFRRQIEVDTEEEAETILEDATIEDVSTNDEWSVDPWEFQKQIRDTYIIEDEEDRA